MTIGLPVWNGEKFLRQAIDSILAQTFADLVLVISDNGSTDKTQEICEAYASRDSRVQYSRSPSNRGAAWNYNRVFELADSDYFKWAAHDDYLAPELIERSVEVLDRDASIALCIADTTIVDSEGNTLKELDYDLDLSEPDRRRRYRSFSQHFSHLKNFHCNPVFGLIRAEVLRETSLIGGYWGSDAVLLGELALRGRFDRIRLPLFFRREHPDRALLANRSLAALSAWFDPQKLGRLRFPRWRCLYEHGRAIFRADMRSSERWSCLVALIRSTRWRYMVKDVRNVARSFLRRRPA